MPQCYPQGYMRYSLLTDATFTLHLPFSVYVIILEAIYISNKLDIMYTYVY